MCFKNNASALGFCNLLYLITPEKRWGNWGLENQTVYLRVTGVLITTTSQRGTKDGLF